MKSSSQPIVDASEAYHLWDQLFSFGVRMALSTSGDTPGEKEAARERFLRGQELALKDRDTMWMRIVLYMGGAHGR